MQHHAKHEQKRVYEGLDSVPEDAAKRQQKAPAATTGTAGSRNETTAGALAMLTLPRMT